MKNVEWIKVQIDIFENPKIKKLMAYPRHGPRMVLMWFQLMTMAAKTNDHGKVYVTEGIPLTEKELVKQFGLPIRASSLSIVRQFVVNLTSLRMLTNTDGYIQIKNFDFYQNADALERIRENGKLRKRRYRASLSTGQSTGHSLKDKDVSVSVPSTYPLEVDSSKNQKNTQENKKGPDEVVMDGVCLAQFDEFWSTYPKTRHIGINDVKRWFKETKVDAALFKKIIHSVNVHKQCTNWQDQDGRFIPKPIKFLRESMWLSEVVGADPFQDAEPEMSMEEMKAEIEKNKKEELDKVLSKYKKKPEEQQPCHGSQSTPT